MPTFSGWGSGEGQPLAFAKLITFKPVSTGTITRGNSTIAAKTVRLETLSGSKQVQGQGGQTYLVDAYILAEFGTDLRVGDIFEIAGQNFEIVTHMPGHTDCAQFYLKLRA